MQAGKFLVPPDNAGGQGQYWKLGGWGLTGSLEEGRRQQVDFAQPMAVIFNSCELISVNWTAVLVVWGV